MKWHRDKSSLYSSTLVVSWPLRGWELLRYCLLNLSSNSQNRTAVVKSRIGFASLSCYVFWQYNWSSSCLIAFNRRGEEVVRALLNYIFICLSTSWSQECAAKKAGAWASVERCSVGCLHQQSECCLCTRSFRGCSKINVEYSVYTFLPRRGLSVEDIVIRNKL